MQITEETALDVLADFYLNEEDSSDRPVFYHGSVVPGMTADRLDPEAAHVRPSTIPRGIAFTSNPMVASNYRRPPRASYKTQPGALIAAHLTMDNPLDITDEVKRLVKGGMGFGAAKLQAHQRLAAEHDGIVFRGDGTNPDEYVVFSTHQIIPVKKAV